jgi:hypothetical protein
MADEWLQGDYIPENKSKYALANNKWPRYRSSWERRFMVWADSSNSVLQWSSEPFAIEYEDMSDPDRPVRRYYPDFVLLVRDTQGRTVKYMVEVKPKKQCPKYTPEGKLLLPPKPKNPTRKAMANWQAKAKTMAMNHSKWLAARRYCKDRNMQFKVITEDSVF